ATSRGEGGHYVLVKNAIVAPERRTTAGMESHYAERIDKSRTTRADQECRIRCRRGAGRRAESDAADGGCHHRHGRSAERVEYGHGRTARRYRARRHQPTFHSEPDRSTDAIAPQ